MSHPCIVENCQRRVTDSTDAPVCAWHWFGVRYFTKQRWAAKRTYLDYITLIAQILKEAEDAA